MDSLESRIQTEHPESVAQKRDVLLVKFKLEPEHLEGVPVADLENLAGALEPGPLRPPPFRRAIDDRSQVLLAQEVLADLVIQEALHPDRLRRSKEDLSAQSLNLGSLQFLVVFQLLRDPDPLQDREVIFFLESEVFTLRALRLLLLSPPRLLPRQFPREPIPLPQDALIEFADDIFEVFGDCEE